MKRIIDHWQDRLLLTIMVTILVGGLTGNLPSNLFVNDLISVVAVIVTPFLSYFFVGYLLFVFLPRTLLRLEQRFPKIFSRLAYHLDIVPVIRLRFNEEPLTALNLNNVISVLNALHTKCWLIEQGRFNDFVEYADFYDSRFDKEAYLVILRITHNSPTFLELLLGSATIAAAMKIAIDAILQAGLRYRDKKLENQKKELELDKERWEFQTKQIDYAVETATKMIDILRPGLDPKTKGDLVQPLIPTLSQLDGIKGLERSLPLRREKSEEIISIIKIQNEN